MRLRKRQHLLGHGLAFVLTGGASALPSAAMIGAKAARNKKADAEMERLIAAIQQRKEQA